MTRRRRWSLLTLLATVASGVVLLAAEPASAGFETFSDPTINQPIGIDEAPDGSLWFANYGNDSIGRIDPNTGAVTNFTDPNIDGPRSVTVAPNGVVWFGSTENGRLGKVQGGAVTTYPAIEQIDDVEVAADGDIWFNGFPAGDESIGRLNPTTEILDTYTVPGFPLRMTPHATDGMWFIWFNDAFSTARIRHITEAGGITGVPTAPVVDPGDITTGSDGNLWFTGDDDDLVARMNPSTGAVTAFSHPQIVAPSEIIDGPGGDLWFAIRSGGRFGRIDPATGAIVTYRDPTDTVEGPIGLAFGGDGNLWYTRAFESSPGVFTGLVGRLVLGSCQGQTVTVDLALGSRPTAGNDVIRGTNAGNTIFGGGGNDVICALGGNDKAYGGVGRDQIVLGPGNDTGDGEANNDKVFGGKGDDVIYLGSGTDLGFGEDDRDILLGEDGSDTVDGGAANDALSGGTGSDNCHGGAGTDTASADCEARTGVP